MKFSSVILLISLWTVASTLAIAEPFDVQALQVRQRPPEIDPDTGLSHNGAQLQFDSETEQALSIDGVHSKTNGTATVSSESPGNQLRVNSQCFILLTVILYMV